MHVLPEAFNLATYIGLWEPTHLESSIARCFYKFYTCLSFALIILTMITQILAMLFFTKTLDEFAETAYMLLSAINASVKGVVILLRRKHVIDLAEMLLKKECVPINATEKRVCSYFNKISRYTVLSCIVLAEGTISALALLPVVFEQGELVLPLRAWYPYNAGSGLGYWLSYLHQAMALTLIAAYDVANDTIITGFMVQACAQLELMTCRFHRFSWRGSNAVMRNGARHQLRLFEKRMVAQSVRHHLLIFRFTEIINSIFAPVILVQFCLSSGVLCITVYQMSASKSNGLKVIVLSLYLVSMLVEFFLYCWFGNEVTLKSLGFNIAVCEMDWTAMHVQTLKELLIIMVRSTSPIFLSCGPLIKLSLESFTNILKISYSAFNVLKQFD
ncbi:odorant receptor 94 [Nasonia vitripennis]|uniref:Odorant receptor n=1 Tax=Nasonia vitripennis TaxID=7425 RepID=A0A7M6UWM6_NASVI|nr:odorant receptor 94 [Nasonia vitripennis]